MRILGIDPGFKATGYGFIEIDPPEIKLLGVGTIEPKAKKSTQEKLLKIHEVLSTLIDEYKPDVLVLEKLYSHYKHPITAVIMGHARGVICLAAAQKNITLCEESVKRVRKSLTGNGNASKLQTRSYVARRLRIQEEKMSLDASDALALALGYVAVHKNFL